MPIGRQLMVSADIPDNDCECELATELPLWQHGTSSSLVLIADSSSSNSRILA